jgi:CheY-like chemotaxis protein
VLVRSSRVIAAQQRRRALESNVMPGHPVRVTRVLIVDDDPAIRRFTARAVRLAGHQVIEACDGVEAFHLATTQGPFDLVLADHLMPEMVGSELARRLRLRIPDVKILFLTGNPRALLADHPTLSRYEALLEKPVTLNELLEAMARLLRGEAGPQAA